MHETVQQLCNLTVVGGTRNRNKFLWLAEQVRAGVFGNALVASTGSGADASAATFPQFQAIDVSRSCACCGGQAALIAGLRDIVRRRRVQREPYDRIVLEVGDEAELEDVVSSVQANSALAQHIRVSEVVVALTGTEGPSLFEDQPLLARQVEMADCVVVTGAAHLHPGFEMAVGGLKPGIPIYGGQGA